MSLLLFQECDGRDDNVLKKWEDRALGDLKAIRFMREHNKQDRLLTPEENEILISWCNGEELNKELLEETK